MNFLAHLYLSGENKDIRFGNFIADAVKGNSFERFPEMIRAGILLHREIDSFTDKHPVVRKSISRLIGRYRKFSGIVVDLYYDHYLAVNWDAYSEKSLEEFVSESYRMLFKRYDLLPARSRRILPFMVTQNWLVGYRNFQALERVFQGMSRRSNFSSGMENAVQDLREHYDEFLDDFNDFFPEIIKHSVTIRENLHLIDRTSQNKTR